MMKRIAILGIAFALAGCATLDAIDSDVTSFSRWPAGRQPGTYAFERLPSQQAEPQEAQVIEDAARQAIESAGFVPAPVGTAPDVNVQLGARISEAGRSPFLDPFWYGAWAPFYRPYGYGRFGRPFWGPGWGYGYGGYGYGHRYFEREVGLLIRDRRSGEPLYEARASSDGLTAGISTVLPAMFAAALKRFPGGDNGSPERIRVPLAPAVAASAVSR